MATHSMHPHADGTSLSRWLVVGFIAGAIGVLVFHQGALAVLHAVGFTQNAPYSVKLVGPLGIPQVASLAFWGGVWGVILAWALRRRDGAGLVASATVFGAILPTLVAWFVVASLKGQPIAAGFVPAAMAVGVIVNAAWGLGTGIGLNLFGRPYPRAARSPTGV
jgi:hypothetical protein